MRPDLGLSAKQRTDLTKNLNIIINCAASLDFEARIDVSMRINTTGALLLMKLAEESPSIEAFLQVSTCYANADRTGYIEERFYEGTNKW